MKDCGVIARGTGITRSTRFVGKPTRTNMQLRYAPC